MKIKYEKELTVVACYDYFFEVTFNNRKWDSIVANVWCDMEQHNFSRCVVCDKFTGEVIATIELDEDEYFE